MKIKRLLFLGFTVALPILAAFTAQVNAASLGNKYTTAHISILEMGVSQGSANQINDKGQICVDSAISSGAWHGFIWENGKTTDLGTLGGEDSQTCGINNNGQVVGNSETSSGAWHGYIWENGEMTDLGTLGGNNSYANGINDKGQIVGYSETSDGLQHGFIWENGKMTDLGTVDGYNCLQADRINENGQIVGVAETSSGVWHACIWENGKMTDLETLDGSYSCACGINDKGQVVGISYTSGHAFIWENGKTTDLGTLGGNNSYASGINDKGQIVGSSETSDGSQHAVIWENGEITDLGTLGGDFSYALGINNKGLVVGHSNASDASNSPIYACIWEYNIDSTPPSISAIEPSDNSILDAKTKITVKASDNVAVSSITLQYSLDGTNWNDIGTQNTEETAEFTWNTTALEGSVKVRAIAVDISGNESTSSPVYTYTVRNAVTTEPALSPMEMHVDAASLTDISVNVGVNKLSSIMNGTGTLTPSVDYNVLGNTVIVKRSYLNYYFKKFPDHNLYLKFNFDNGSSSVFTIYTGDTPHVVLADSLSYKLGSGDAELSFSPNGNFITSVKNGNDLLVPRIDYTYAPSTNIFYIRKGYLNRCFSKSWEPLNITVGFTGDSPKTVVITPEK